MYSYWWRWLLTWPTRCWSLTFSKWLQRITHNSNGNTQQQQQQQQKEPNSGAKPFIKTMPMLTTNQCNYQAKLRLCSTPLHTPHSTPIQSNPRSTRLDANFQLLAKRPKRKERRHRKKQKKNRRHIKHASCLCQGCCCDSGNLRDTLPPTPTRRSRCYQQLLCTRLAAPSQMKTKQKEQYSKQQLQPVCTGKK